MADAILFLQFHRHCSAVHTMATWGQYNKHVDTQAAVIFFFLFASQRTKNICLGGCRGSTSNPSPAAYTTTEVTKLNVFIFFLDSQIQHNATGEEPLPVPADVGQDQSLLCHHGGREHRHRRSGRQTRRQLNADIIVSPTYFLCA